MPKPDGIELSAIPGTRFSRFITYPATEADNELTERLDELAATGISKLYFVGSTHLGGIPVLGKGCVGVVVQASLDGFPVALKIRRTDADRSSLFEEGRLLRVANSVGVGPGLVTVTRNFLVMELFDGLPLYKWAELGRRSHSRSVLENLLHACFKLDAIGLDHGELSHAPRNVLVSSQNKPCIVDFESASTSRRVSNVTSLIQYFLFGQLAKQLGAKLYRNRKSVLLALSAYKQDGSVLNFNRILETLILRSIARA